MTNAVRAKKRIQEETSMRLIWVYEWAQGRSYEEIPYEWRPFSRHLFCCLPLTPYFDNRASLGENPFIPCGLGVVVP